MELINWGRRLAFIIGLTSPLLAHALDTDGDTIDDSTDLCVSFYNPNQTDTDGDTIGDACDTDGVDYTISTVAGNGATGFNGDGGLATNTSLYHPFDVAVDSSGNLYIADYLNHRIRKVTSDGSTTTVAGNGTAGFSGDGAAATSATLNNPIGIALDNSGNLYIADRNNLRIRKVTTDGIISTVAGNGSAVFSGDGGVATNAGLYYPSGVTVDSSGSIFIADTNNHRVRKVIAGGIISTIAGIGSPGFGGDGAAATSANLNNPFKITVDSSGNLFIADSSNHRIRKVSTSGTITTVAGNGSAGFSGDGAAATNAALNNPGSVAFDSSGNLFIADAQNHRIRKVSTEGTISTVAGNGTAGFNINSDGVSAVSTALNSPTSVAVDGSGNLFIADNSNHRIRKASLKLSDADGDFVAIFLDNCPNVANTDQTDTDSDGQGNACDSDDDNDGLSDTEEASLGTNPLLSDTDGDGFADKLDSCAAFYNPNQEDTDTDTIGDACDTDGVEYTISTVAGTGSAGPSGDGGAATSANIYNPYDTTVDSSGNVYIAELSNHRIRKVSTDGTISTIAGTGSAGFSGDGAAATGAALSAPTSVAIDSSGNLYIADLSNHRIRKVDTDGIITTIAGNGSASFSGDGADATSAALNSPIYVTVDNNGNLYIADRDNHRIRKVSTDGIISTIAGTSSAGFSGDGAAATSASLYQPSGVSIDSSGNLYIADRNNRRIRKVSMDGTISTVAGTGSAGFNGDGGAATSASLYNPYGVTVDVSGNLYIADYNNHRIRKVATDGTISTVAGIGSPGFSGDGEDATSAALQYPISVTLDNGGNLYITDTSNQRIRKATLNLSDGDGDFIASFLDNCPNTASTDLTDTDNDGRGDVCDSDDDNDGLSDTEEASLGTNPLLADSDADGYNDDVEVAKGTNPLFGDSDGDGLSNEQEATAGTNPLKADTDGNGLSDFFDVNAQGPAPSWVTKGTLYFGVQSNVSRPLNLARLMAADFNLDGLTDLVYTDNSKTYITYQKVDGSYDDAVEILASVSLKFISADIDGDGDLDIYTLKSNNRLSVLVNNGTHGFEAIEFTTSYSNTREIKALELNAERDGLELRLLTNNNYYDIEFDIGTGSFDAVTHNNATTNLYAVNHVDLNGDGYLDQLLSNNSYVYWSENLQNGTFTPAIQITSPRAQLYQRINAFDVKGSALNDIVYFQSTSLYLVENLGEGNFEAIETLHTFSSAIVDLDHADFDLDGDIDLVVALSDAIYVVTNNGDGTFTVSDTDLSNATGINDLSIADMNNDGAPDIILTSVTDSKLGIILNNTLTAVSGTQAIAHPEFQTNITVPATATGFIGTASYSLAGADAALFEITANGELSFNTAPSAASDADANGDNVYEVTLVASNHTASNMLLEISITAADPSTDPDNDGLTNAEEITAGTNPNVADTDGDGVNDGEEVTAGTDPTVNETLDSDNDGLTDAEEAALGTDPTVADSDGDGTNDGDEVTAGTDPMVNDVVDTDNDGLTDVQEAALGTDPNVADSDDDGVSDGDEVNAGTDPSVNQATADTDGDSLFDLDEINVHGTNPNLIDSDFDGVNDGDEVAVGTDPTTVNTDYIISFEDGLLPSAYVAVDTADAGWIIDDSTAVNGLYSLRAEVIDHNQTAAFEFSYYSDGSDLNFSAKVSSEEGYDGLNILIDGVNAGTLTGELDWSEYSVEVPEGQHTLKVEYLKDGSNSIGSDTVWIDNIRFKAGISPVDQTDTDNDGLIDVQEANLGTNPNSIDTDADGVNDGDEVIQQTNPLIAEANIIVGFEGGLMPSSSVTLNPESKDNLGWEISNTESSQGNYSMRAKSVGGAGQFNEVSFVAYFSGATDFTFDYKTTTVGGLDLYIDNVPVERMGGEANWQPYQYAVPAGLHVVSFVYGQNSNNPSGEDTAWVDNIRFHQAQYGPDDDMDQDGLSNSEEVTAGTAKVIADSDQDGLNDGDEVNNHQTNPTLADTDSDGVNDGDEVNNYQTDPKLADTDGDGISDGDEITAGTDPRTNGNSGGDGGNASDKLTEGGGGGSLAYFSLLLILISLARRRSLIRK